ncbi:MAG TPA: AAA family ATPase [Longimicrobiales bacterium]|nr:AAA family ATPase [Longimicrobiales bacterium]
MADDIQQFDQLSAGAQLIVRAALDARRASDGSLGLNQWLAALLERHAAMLERIAPDIRLPRLRQLVNDCLQQGDTGAQLTAADLIAAALERAHARGADRAVERDLAAVVLAATGFTVEGERPAEDGAARSPLSAAATAPYTPLLDQYGRDLTREAAEGRLSSVVGRDEETDLVIETICRRTKRNPLLVGPAGVGKTAIVEGLAQRIHSGAVPAVLQGARVIAIQPSSLVAGASMAGELERRVQGILSEAAQPGVLLFIDEVHSMIGAGGSPGTSDIASLLKPAIARGSLVCIAATTDEEYRTFIERDAALERRFQPIRVQQMTADQTLLVLRTLHRELVQLRGVEIPDDLLEWLVGFAAETLRNRHFPDKAVDLLEQCVAFAVARGRQALTRADVESVVRRMTGMPLGLDARLAAAAHNLHARGCMDDATIDAVIARLNITMRGLDVRPDRPNAVLLVETGRASADLIAATLAQSLFGDAARVVTLEFARLRQPQDITMLIGAPPGYIGYSESLPIHRIAQMPFCVVLCDAVDAADPGIRDLFARCIVDGCITDARGKRIHIRDTILVMTTSAEGETRRSVGFHGGATVAAGDGARVELGALAAHVDVVCAPVAARAGHAWLRQGVLSDLATRYQKHGLLLEWDDTFVQWLVEQHADSRDIERLLDTEVNPHIAAHLPASGTREERPLVVMYAGTTVQVQVQAGSPQQKD